MENIFYYYRNHTLNYVRIHKANCHFCNNGAGVQDNVLGNENGEWSDLFDNYQDALFEANLIAILPPFENAPVHNCQVCL